jgi:hypothetical protein
MHVLGVPVVLHQQQAVEGNSGSCQLTGVKLHLNLLFIVLQEERLETVSKSVTANMSRCQHIIFKADKADREQKSIDVEHGWLDM